MSKRSAELKHLSDLKPDARNARHHNPRNLGMIADSLREVGAARSGVIDEDGNILAGNGTWEALAEAGIERVKVVEADGNEWVVVQRKGLTPEQKRKLAIADNRTSELADWDPTILLEDIGNGLDLSGLWRDNELEKLLRDEQMGDADLDSLIAQSGDQEGKQGERFRIVITGPEEQKSEILTALIQVKRDHGGMAIIQ